MVLITLAFGQNLKLDSGRLSPRLLNYQGYLTDTLGNPITNPSASLTFGIYDAVSAGNLKWSESQAGVSINKGIFHVLLGSVTQIPDSVFNNTNRWLQLSVAGQTLTPRTRIVSVPYAYTATYSDTAVYARISAPDDDWVRGTPDSVLYTIRQLGLVRGGADNMLYGDGRFTHTNLGVACTTGTSGQNNYYCTIGGGLQNNASGLTSTVAGGYADTSASSYSFTVGWHSVVPSSYSYSAAFNGMVATSSDQLRCGTLAKAGGTFTIDHPVDPQTKILNHYFIEGPEMLNIYRGTVMLDAKGRAEVTLPDYFSALNKNPHIQLTGVGSSEVYVAEEIKGNRFVIGGKPNMKVFWQVSGERQDVSAETIRRMMPVEQEKSGALAGRMLDDDFLAGCMAQLEREGKAQGINFRTAAGRQRYEDMKRQAASGNQ